MQELVLQGWCDACGAGKRVAATVRFLVAIDLYGHGGRQVEPKVLDLCDKHRAVVDQVRDLASKVGIAPPKEGVGLTPKSPAQREKWADRRSPTACKVCGLVIQRQTYIGHLVDVHGAKRLVQPRKCPDCGESFNPVRGMINHRRNSHGYDYVAAVEATAKR